LSDLTQSRPGNHITLNACSVEHWPAVRRLKCNELMPSAEIIVNFNLPLRENLLALCDYDFVPRQHGLKIPSSPVWVKTAMN